MPQPLTPSDKNNLAKIAKVIDMAHDLDMRVYLVISANVIPNDALAEQATFEERHFFHCDLRVNPAEKKAVQRMMARRKELFRPIAKTDGVSIIDSDPGGYPGSTNEEFISLLGEHRKMLNNLRPGIELIYWLHASWPAYSEYYKTNRFRWGKIQEYEQALTLLKTLNPEPWGFANGLQLAEKLGISESRVINFRYGAIEAEPSYPLTNFGGDQAYEAGGQGAPKGVMGNAQAHCVQLPNTFAFARGALHKPIEEKDYIQFANDLIPGQGKLIVDAWKILNADSPKAIYNMIQKLEQVNSHKLIGGPLKGLLFNEPQRFINDLVLQLRFKSAYMEFYTASKNDKPIK